MRELQNSSQFYKNMVQEYKRSHYRVNLREVDTEENRNRVAAHSGGLVLQCQDEKCNGFLCNRTYMCNSCGKKTCPSCHTIADDDNHQCKEEDLESVRLLQQDTKSCPKCSMGVHKIEGCRLPFGLECTGPTVPPDVALGLHPCTSSLAISFNNRPWLLIHKTER